MKIVIEDDNFIIYIIKSNSSFENISKDEIEKSIKKILLYIKKKYKKNISGFYNVNLYNNSKYGYILEIIKQNELDFFPDIVDIKLKIYENSKMFLMFKDYFIINNNNIYYYDNNYYLDINEVDNNILNILSDFYSIIYGSKLESIINKLKLVKN